MSKSLLLNQVPEVLRLRYYSIRTEAAYVQAIRRFIVYHRKRHPREMELDETLQLASAFSIYSQLIQISPQFWWVGLFPLRR